MYIIIAKSAAYHMTYNMSHMTDDEYDMTNLFFAIEFRS